MWINIDSFPIPDVPLQYPELCKTKKKGLTSGGKERAMLQALISLINRYN